MNQNPMPQWAQRIMTFMAGRNGPDALGRFCLWIYFILLILNLFFRTPVISVFSLAVAVYAIFRMFSKNVTARRAESLRYWNLREKVRRSLGNVTVFKKIGNWFGKRMKRLGKLGTNRFRTCPACKAELCLPRKKGKHTVRCPRCGKEFSVRILF